MHNSKLFYTAPKHYNAVLMHHRMLQRSSRPRGRCDERNGVRWQRNDAIDSLTVQISICMILATKLLQRCSRNDTFEDWRRCRTAIAVQSSRQQLHCDMLCEHWHAYRMYTQSLMKRVLIPVCLCVVHEHTSLVRAVPPLLWQKRSTFCSTLLALPTACWKNRNGRG